MGTVGSDSAGSGGDGHEPKIGFKQRICILLFFVANSIELAGLLLGWDKTKPWLIAALVAACISLAGMRFGKRPLKAGIRKVVITA